MEGRHEKADGGGRIYTVFSAFKVLKFLLHSFSLPDAPRQEKPSIGSTRVARTACDMRICEGLCSFRVFDSLSTS